MDPGVANASFHGAAAWVSPYAHRVVHVITSSLRRASVSSY